MRMTGAIAAITSVRVGQTRRGPFSGGCVRPAVPDRNGTTFLLYPWLFLHGLPVFCNRRSRVGDLVFKVGGHHCGRSPSDSAG